MPHVYIHIYICTYIYRDTHADLRASKNQALEGHPQKDCQFLETAIHVLNSAEVDQTARGILSGGCLEPLLVLLASGSELVQPDPSHGPFVKKAAFSGAPTTTEA